MLISAYHRYKTVNEIFYFILFIGAQSLELVLCAHSTTQFTPAAFPVSTWGYIDAPWDKVCPCGVWSPVGRHKPGGHRTVLSWSKGVWAHSPGGPSGGGGCQSPHPQNNLGSGEVRIHRVPCCFVFSSFTELQFTYPTAQLRAVQCLQYAFWSMPFSVF